MEHEALRERFDSWAIDGETLKITGPSGSRTRLAGDLDRIAENAGMIELIFKDGPAAAISIDSPSITADQFFHLANWAQPSLKLQMMALEDGGASITVAKARAPFWKLWFPSAPASRAGQTIEFLPAAGSGFPSLKSGDVVLTLDHARFDVAAWASGRAIVSDGLHEIEIPLHQGRGVFLLFLVLLEWCGSPDDRLVD